MNIDGLDTAHGLAQVNYDELRYLRLLQKFFDDNLIVVRKIEEAFYDDLNQEALRLATNLQIAAELLGAHAAANEAEALGFALKSDWPNTMIERQIEALHSNLQALLEDVRWYL